VRDFISSQSDLLEAKTIGEEDDRLVERGRVSTTWTEPDASVGSHRERARTRPPVGAREGRTRPSRSFPRAPGRRRASRRRTRPEAASGPSFAHVASESPGGAATVAARRRGRHRLKAERKTARPAPGRWPGRVDDDGGWRRVVVCAKWRADSDSPSPGTRPTKSARRRGRNVRSGEPRSRGSQFELMVHVRLSWTQWFSAGGKESFGVGAS